MLKTEHIGIAVKELSTSVILFEKLLNSKCYKTEMVESEKVNTAFFQKGETKIELLESTSPDGVIARFIERKGEGLHHIAFEVADIRAEMKRLQSEGFVLLNEEPKKGADNKLVCFLHPKGNEAAPLSGEGVLIELIQAPPEVIDAFALMGMEAAGSTPAELAARLKADTERWGPLVKAIGFTAEG